MNRIVVSLILACLGLSLAACSNANGDNDNIVNATSSYDLSQVVIKSKDANKASIVSNKDDIGAIDEQFEQKKTVLLKMLPIFKYEIEMVYGNTKTVWLFAKPGYVTQQGKEGSQLFQLSDPSVLTKHLK